MIGILAVFVLLVSKALAFGSPIDSADVHVIDGDTIRVHHQKPDVRLAPQKLAVLPARRRLTWEPKPRADFASLCGPPNSISSLCRVHVSQERKEHRGAITADVAGH